MPDYGNKLSHDKLFSGKYKDEPGYTPDRRWLISEFIFDAKMNRLLEYTGQRDIDGKRYNVLAALITGLTNVVTYTTLLNSHGNPIKHYGDLDLEMSCLKLDQAGAISRFIA